MEHTTMVKTLVDSTGRPMAYVAICDCDWITEHRDRRVADLAASNHLHMNDKDRRTNQDRADRAYRFALTYAHEMGGEDIESAIVDLIADLAHCADDYMGGAEALHMGAIHYHAEREEETQ